MFENLSDRLERSFKILKGEGKITEINVAETMKDVRRALLDADVNYKVAKEFTNKAARNPQRLYLVRIVFLRLGFLYNRPFSHGASSESNKSGQ